MTELDKAELEKLLPFYVNGTLTGDERRQVEQHLAEDENFRAEKKYLEALQKKIKEQTVEQSPGELGLARLHASIRAEKPVRAIPQRIAASNVVQGWWRPVAIAACIAVAVLASAQVNTVFFDEGYTTASGGAETSGPVFQIFFNEKATEKDIRDLLRQRNLNIIEGPTALGFYRVEYLEKTESRNTASVIQELEADKSVTEVLEE